MATIIRFKLADPPKPVFPDRRPGSARMSATVKKAWEARDNMTMMFEETVDDSMVKATIDRITESGVVAVVSTRRLNE